MQRKKFIVFTLILSVFFYICVYKIHLRSFTSKYDNIKPGKELNYIKNDNKFTQNMPDSSTTSNNECFDSENVNQSLIYFQKNNPHWHAAIICDEPEHVLNVGVIQRIAWLDTRQNLADTPCLRLHVTLNADLYETSGKNSSSVYQDGVYRMFASIGNELNVELSKYGVYDLTGARRNVAGVIYKEYSLVYSLPKDKDVSELGDTVTLQLLWPNRTSALSYHIQVGKSKQSTRTSDKQGFVVLVNALYGQFPEEDESFFIEWVEFLQILGVEEIHLYNASWQVSNHMRNILDFYHTKGVVYLHPFEHPFIRRGKVNGKDTYPYDTAGLLQRSSTNHCFYTVKDRFRFMISIDLDELIVPFYNSTYQEVIDWLTQVDHQNLSEVTNIQSNWGNYYRFFDKTDNSSTLRTMQYRDYSHNFVRPKSFINTDMCMYGFAHGCTHPKEPKIKIKIAETHHYRKACKFNCKDLGDIKTNKHILRFNDKLEDRVNRSIEKIKMHSSRNKKSS